MQRTGLDCLQKFDEKSYNVAISSPDTIIGFDKYHYKTMSYGVGIDYAFFIVLLLYSKQRLRHCTCIFGGLGNLEESVSAKLLIRQ